ncbi:hypothetical protein QQF64_034461 [Cirrhinus molitorella]|uniref:Reverse transcriptase domain-containing protein n=1 Tax=Cirrhinus molitorella TaxID=172907 RepID=A0ABR3L278_9TELE
MRERIDCVMPLVWEHLAHAQQAQQCHFDRAAQPREFQPGDRVVVLIPNAACKFLATWQGPYTVIERIGPHHLERLRTVLSELRRAGLTANPRKCHLAQSEAKYLGFQVGQGLIRPQEKIIEAIHAAPRPISKTQVRAFLGLAGYYKCFIPNFSSLAASLTDLTKKGQPEKVQWTSATEEIGVATSGTSISTQVDAGDVKPSEQHRPSNNMRSFQVRSLVVHHASPLPHPATQ